MTDKQAEELAASKVKDYINYTNKLSPYITENDKTPLWDGHIFIYKNTIHSNNNLIGRVSTQIKGKRVKKSIRNTFITYPVEAMELEKYKSDGGLIYFVVLIHGEERTIYYAKLTPLILQEYIDKNIYNRNKVRIKLDILHNNKEQFEKELYIFLKDCNRQKENVNYGRVISINDLSNMNNSIKLNLFIPEENPDTDSIFEYITTNEVYLYVEDTSKFNHKFWIPIKEGPFILEGERFLRKDVSINGKKYYDKIKIDESSENRHRFHINNSVEIVIEKYINKFKLCFNININRKWMDEWVNDAEFILDMFSNKCIYIGNAPLNIPKCDEFHIQDLCDRLTLFRKTLKLLELLNVEEKLDVQNMNIKDIEALKILTKAIIEKKEVKIKEDLKPFLLVDISNISLALSSQKISSGIYRIYNYDHCKRFYFKNELSDNKYKTCVYSCFDKEAYTKASNIKYDKIYSSYKEIYEEDNNILYILYRDISYMILAYDEKPNSKLISEVIKLCSWLVEIDQETNIHKINLLQIKKRTGEISETEKDEIQSIIDKSDLNIEKLSCYLLLDDKDQAHHYYNLLNRNDKKFFKSLPIYKFYSK